MSHPGRDDHEFWPLRSPGGLPFCLVAHRAEEVRPEPVGTTCCVTDRRPGDV